MSCMGTACISDLKITSTINLVSQLMTSFDLLVLKSTITDEHLSSNVSLLGFHTGFYFKDDLYGVLLTLGKRWPYNSYHYECFIFRIHFLSFCSNSNAKASFSNKQSGPKIFGQHLKMYTLFGSPHQLIFRLSWHNIIWHEATLMKGRRSRKHYFFLSLVWLPSSDLR